MSGNRKRSGELGDFCLTICNSSIACFYEATLDDSRKLLTMSNLSRPYSTTTVREIFD